MGYVNPRGFHTYEEGDLHANASQLLNAGQNEAVWQPLTLAGGATGSAQYAIIRGEVWFRAQITNAMTAGATLAAATLPVGVRPTGQHMPLTAFCTGTSISAAALTTGELRLQNDGSNSPTNAKYVAGRWPLP